MPEEKEALLGELRKLLKGNAEGESVNRIIKDLQTILEEELGVEILAIPRFILSDKASQKERKMDEPVGVLQREKKGKILDIWLLREFPYPELIAYKELYACFIPEGLREKASYQTILHYVIMEDLSQYKLVKEYDNLIWKEYLQEREMEVAIQDLQKFFSNSLRVQFFFQFIRTHYKYLRKVKGDHLNYELFYAFYSENNLAFSSDEVVETIRVLIKVFYKVKDYDSLKSFSRHFKEMKSKGELNTDLSLRKFKENVKLIREQYTLSPTFKIIFPRLGVISSALKFPFSPRLPDYSIRKIINRVPRLYARRISKNSFGAEYMSYYIIPSVFKHSLGSLLKRLEESGYKYQEPLIEGLNSKNFLNLNYFRQYHFPKERLINPDFVEYDPAYEIVFTADYEVSALEENSFDFLDFLLIERLKNQSLHGLGFVSKRRAINLFNTDLFNYVIRKKMNVSHIREISARFDTHEDQKVELINLLLAYKKEGVYMLLDNLKDLADILGSFQKKFSTFSKRSFKEIMASHGTGSLKKEVALTSKRMKKILYRYYNSSLFRDKTALSKKQMELERYLTLLKSYTALGVYKIEVIIGFLKDKEKRADHLNETLSELKRLRERTTINLATIDEKIAKFISNGAIKPNLISSIFVSLFTNYFLEVTLRYHKEVEEALEKIAIYFPRVASQVSQNVYGTKQYLMVIFYVPSYTSYEKYLFLSVLYRTFSEDLLSAKRYFWSGSVEITRLKDTYNFLEKRYKRDTEFISQTFAYAKALLGGKKKLPPKKYPADPKIFDMFFEEAAMPTLVKTVEDRVLSRRYAFDPKGLKELSIFHRDLKGILLDKERFLETKARDFFAGLVDSISFIPAFSKFGFSQYYLYIYPEDLSAVDYKLLFLNSFQKVSYPAEIDASIPLFIRYLFAYKNPSDSYINWYVKSKKGAREYIFYTLNSIYHTFHTDRILDAQGWELDHKKFLTHAENILFDPAYDSKGKYQNRRKFEVSGRGDAFLGPKSKEYRELTEIYDIESSDLKTLTSSLYKKRFESAQDLLRKDLIYPYFKLKNADLSETFHIIVPGLKEEYFPKLLDIFSYFPYSFIARIEGEYLIKGQVSETTFQDGMMVKLDLLGNMDYDEFFEVFEQIFTYFECPNYLILHDLVDGKTLLENTFGDLEFMNKYNPLKNFKWSEVDTCWVKPKVYDEYFHALYSDLDPRYANED